MTKAMSILLLHRSNVEATVEEGHLALAFQLEVCKLLYVYIYTYIYIYIYILNFAICMLCMTNYL